MPRTSLSLPEARRLAISAQGLHRQPVSASSRHGAGKVHEVVKKLGLVQIDSVNVLARAHLLTLHARLGAFDPAGLDVAASASGAGGTSGGLIEYWGHEASFLPAVDQPLWRWRMADARAERGIYAGLVRFRKENKKFIDAVLKEIEKGGPMSAGELTGGGKSKGAWWGWSKGKRAIEWLFWAGLVTTAQRRSTFERVYDLTERVLPPEVMSAPTPDRDEAQRELMRRALRASGVATEKDLRDYPRLPAADAKARFAELVEAGEALPVEVGLDEGVSEGVGGWSGAVIDPKARLPRRVAGRALLCPFDPLIWTRDRTERLFGMRYRLEIYVPAEQRVHGYYVLPFLLGDTLAARVDLKADRKNKLLLVQAAHLEPEAPQETTPELAATLRRMADWLELEHLKVGRRGGLANELRKACRR